MHHRGSDAVRETIILTRTRAIHAWEELPFSGSVEARYEGPENLFVLSWLSALVHKASRQLRHTDHLDASQLDQLGQVDQLDQDQLGRSDRFCPLDG